jgi:ligand-binding sensor domain-containing protein
MATCFLPEDENHLWIGTESGKLILYDSKINKIIREISVPGINNQTAISSLFKDSQKRLWIVGSGVAFLNK